MFKFACVEMTPAVAIRIPDMVFCFVSVATLLLQVLV